LVAAADEADVFTRHGGIGHERLMSKREARLMR
jgi:hypothetical protein